MILTHSKEYLVKDSYSALKKCFLGNRQRNVQWRIQLVSKKQYNMRRTCMQQGTGEEPFNDKERVCAQVHTQVCVCVRQRGICVCDTYVCDLFEKSVATT